MDRGHQFIRGCCDDCTCRKGRTCRVAPDIVQSGKGKDRIVSYVEVERDFASALLFPLKEPARGNDATFRSQKIPEHRLLRETLGPGIEWSMGGRDVFCPVRHEAPLHHDRFCPLVHDDHRVRAARRDIEMRPEPDHRVDDPEPPAEVIDTGKRVPATHDEWSF